MGLGLQPLVIVGILPGTGVSQNCLCAPFLGGNRKRMSLGNGVRKMASAIGVRIDDVGSILKFCIGFLFGESSACFCQSVWLPGSILGGLISATLFADTVSNS